MTQREITKTLISDQLESFGVMEMPDVAKELLDAFVQSAVALCRDLETALKSRDAHASGVAAHTLKGTARNLNATNLGQRCQDLEGRLAAGQDCDRELALVNAELTEVLSVISEIINGLEPQ